MKKKHLTVLFVIATLCSFVTFNLSAAEKHPFYELTRVLGGLRDSFDNFETLESQIDKIEPRDCEVDNIKISKAEMEFLLTIFKLDFAVTLKKGAKGFQYAHKLEEIIQKNSIDYKKLSKLFDNDLNFEALVDIDIPMAYIVANRAEHCLEKVQNSLKKYKSGSYEYVMLRFALSVAFFKTGKANLALNPALEAYEYFKKNGPDTYAALAASNLSCIYHMKNDQANAEKYQSIAMSGASATNSTMVKCEQALVEILKLLDAADSKLDSNQRKSFEANRKFILEKSSSDLQIWAVYVFSSIIKEINNYPNEEVLTDLEKAFLYRTMLWGDAAVDNSVKQIDEILGALKSELFKKLSDAKQIDKLNYWIAAFEKSSQRKVAMEQMAKRTENINILPLLEAISRYEYANQIIALEINKPAAAQDKAMIAKATAIKRDLEQIFDAAKKKLSAADAKKMESLLADNYIIHPDSLGQLAKVLPTGVACMQFLLIEDRVVVYLISHKSTPFITIINLPEKKLTGKRFIGKILRTRTLLQANAPVEKLQSELKGIYDIIFREIEPALQKLTCNTLLINSSGILRYLPFAALYDGNKYLVEKYQITNITGLDLVRLSQSKATKNYNRTNAVIFADPDGSLPAGKNEGEFVSKLFPNAKLYIGNNATLDEFETLLGNVNFIHLATHAVLDSNNPADSYVLFANGKKWKYSDMMGFHAQDIDSIVLSACSTAISEKSTGGEIEGMAYQLLRKSPSGSVLASFWNVDDHATSILMKEYYSHIIKSIKDKNSLGRGEALRAAQLKLLKSAKTSSPYYWAAFTLFGDFR